jgi:AcrR family transcriptional regulator
MLDPAVRAGFRRRAITAAMAELCVEQGYLATSVADVAARARMSRATVYGLFANREQIFLTLLDHGVSEVLGLAEGSCRRAGLDPRARIEAALEAILSWVAEHPTEAYAFLVEAQAATPEALRHYHAAIEDLAALLGTAVPVAEVGSVRLEGDHRRRARLGPRRAGPSEPARRGAGATGGLRRAGDGSVLSDRC